MAILRSLSRCRIRFGGIAFARLPQGKGREYESEIWRYERLMAHVEMGGRGIDLRYPLS
jgi:hypothetical protein